MKIGYLGGILIIAALAIISSSAKPGETGILDEWYSQRSVGVERTRWTQDADSVGKIQ